MFVRQYKDVPQLYHVVVGDIGGETVLILLEAVVLPESIPTICDGKLPTFESHSTPDCLRKRS